MGKTILLKGMVMEDFCNYKKPSMYLATCYCDWKCCGEDKSICQNSPLAKAEIRTYDIENLCLAYVQNPITQAVVIGGLEPLLQAEEVLDFIASFRDVSDDDIVIYTGYTEEEVSNNPRWSTLRQKGIIIKYGRFIPNSKSRYDEILGMTLASDNQYAVRY